MSGTLIYNKEIDFSKANYWEGSVYFESQFLVLQVKDLNSAYSFSIGKVWIIPFLPGFGDTRFTYQEISEGFNLLQSPGISKQWKFGIQPFSKVGKLQIKVFWVDYKSVGNYQQPGGDWTPGVIDEDELDGGSF